MPRPFRPVSRRSGLTASPGPVVRSPRPMAMLKKALPVLVVAALALVGWQVVGTLRGGRPESAPGSATASAPQDRGSVTALGRLEPRDGAMRIAGPSRPSLVVGKLLVDENDVVKMGQI